MTSLATAPVPTKGSRRQPKSFSCSIEAASVRINGARYHAEEVTGITDPFILRAWRFEKSGDDEAVYDVAKHAHGGISCTCPDWETRHYEYNTAGCKHVQCAVALGFLTRAERGMERPALVPGVNRVRDEFDEPAPVVVEVAPIELPAPISGGSPEAPEAVEVPAAVKTTISPVTGRTLYWDGAGWTSSKPNAEEIVPDRSTPCCRPEEGDAPCLGCATATVEVEAPADPESPPLPLTDLDLEPPADLGPASSWPAWTDEDRWTIADEVVADCDTPSALLTLDQLIEAEADRLAALGNAAGDLMARTLAELAKTVRFVQATTPGDYLDRLEVIEAEAPARPRSIHDSERTRATMATGHPSDEEGPLR